MIRIGPQPTVQPAAQGGPAQPAPNSLQSLMAALEEAIQRLTQQQGGPQPTGGDRMEHHHHHHHHHHHRAPAQGTNPGGPVATGPVQTQPAPTGPVQIDPGKAGPITIGPGGHVPSGVDLPDGLPDQAMGAEAGGIVNKGLAGGTVGT